MTQKRHPTFDREEDGDQPTARVRRLRILIIVLCIFVLGIGLARFMRPEPIPIDLPPERPGPTSMPMAFSQMRPLSGARLVLPCLGFRWSFHPNSDQFRLEREDAVPDGVTPDTGPVLFYLRIADLNGKVRLTEETLVSDLQVTLPLDTESGVYEWWVEASLPGESQKITSRRQKFFLLP